MLVFRNERRFGYILAILFGAGMILGGCAPTFNSLHDPVANFSTFKSYRWTTESNISRREPLVERNVRFFADEYLKSKGFTLTSDSPDFWISMNYQLDYYTPYEVKVLNLYIYRMQGKELIWQGTAAGTIVADDASPDLAEATKKILANFPPPK